MNITAPYFIVEIDVSETPTKKLRRTIVSISEIFIDCPHIVAGYYGPRITLDYNKCKIKEVPLEKNITFSKICKEFNIKFSSSAYRKLNNNILWSTTYIFVNHKHKNFGDLYLKFLQIFPRKWQKKANFVGKRISIPFSAQLDMSKKFINNKIPESENNILKIGYTNNAIPINSIINSDNNDFQLELFKKINYLMKYTETQIKSLHQKKEALDDVFSMIPDEIKLLYEVED